MQLLLLRLLSLTKSSHNGWSTCCTHSSAIASAALIVRKARDHHSWTALRLRLLLSLLRVCLVFIARVGCHRCLCRRELFQRHVLHDGTHARVI